MFLDLLKDFKKETDTLIEEVNHLYSQKDIEGIMTIMHTIKGSSGSVGLIKIYQESKKLEQQIKNENVTKLKSGLNDVFKEYERFVNWLETN